MEKKKLGLRILVMVLVFGMTVVGCDNNPEDDTWRNVTSLSQVNGTWNGSFTYTEADEDGITIRSTIEISMTINSSAGTVSGFTITSVTFSGSNIITYWPLIKEEFPASEGWTINDSTHSATMTETITPEPVSLADLAGFQINQYGTKIKQPASYDSPEIIFTKQ